MQLYDSVQKLWKSVLEMDTEIFVKYNTQA